jgi:4-oxalocrotonate tautomerase
MPHVIVKIYPGRSEEQKLKLADEIAKSIVTIAKCEQKSVSVAFEEIESVLRKFLCWLEGWRPAGQRNR